MLVNNRDFQNEFTSSQLMEAMRELMFYNIIPIVNANDAIASPPELDKDLVGVRATPHSKYRIAVVSPVCVYGYIF